MVLPVKTVDTIGKDVKRVAKAKVAEATSPTSVIPLKDFCWASTPLAKEVSVNAPIATTRTSDKAKKKKGELCRLMQPRGRALVHPAGPLLLEYARDGCPVDVD